MLKDCSWKVDVQLFRLHTLSILEKNWPKLFAFLKRKEDKLKSKRPWKFIGDYFIITLKKKTG